MKYRYLGKSGLLVSRICLGTMTFGMEGWGCDPSTATEMVNQFIDEGGNFLDTADMYSAGVSEEIVGRAVEQHQRDQLVLATKCWFRMNDSPNAKGLSRKHVMEAVDDSLRRLGTDYIDLYQVHGPDPFTPLEETLRALEDLVRSGKIRYLGCSNYYGWQITRANGIAERLGLSRFISGQHLYNLLRRDIEREILPACKAEGMGILPWSPLASGLLTGKYLGQEEPDPDSRVGQRAEIDVPRYWTDKNFRVIEEVVSVAEELDRTPAQIALAWLLGERSVSSVIVGVRKPSQLTDSLFVGDWDLPEEHYERLRSVAAFQPGYPREWIESTWENIAGEEEFPPWEIAVDPKSG